MSRVEKLVNGLESLEQRMTAIEQRLDALEKPKRRATTTKSTTAAKTTASKTITAGSVYNGLAQFTQVGCGTCHVPTQTTRDGDPFHPYSDFALHSMGDALADGIIQGNAAKDEFRTAPLWGIGQRIYFLHDGRTYNLLEAIQAHKSDGSEANTVIDKFNKLTATQKQDILNFLRSL